LGGCGGKSVRRGAAPLRLRLRASAMSLGGFGQSCTVKRIVELIQQTNWERLDLSAFFCRFLGIYALLVTRLFPIPQCGILVRGKTRFVESKYLFFSIQWLHLDTYNLRLFGDESIDTL